MVGCLLGLAEHATLCTFPLATNPSPRRSPMAQPDTDERRAQMFPRLTEAQLKRIAAIGRRRAAASGTVLFAQGDQEVHFFVVVSGTLEVVSPGAGDTTVLITVHYPGEFSGEASMLSARRSLVTGRMREDGEVIELTRECLRKVVQTDSELSEIFMRAFILRRMRLIAAGQGDVILLGSTHSSGTL